MENSPLQLKSYFITEFHFALDKDHRSPTSSETFVLDLQDLKIDVKPSQHVEKPKAWQFLLEVALDNKQSRYPYKFKVVVIGFFEVIEDYPLEKSKFLALVNAPSILYSSVRELLLMMTSRGIHPPILLPTVSFFSSTLTQKKPTKKTKSVDKQ